MNVLLFLLLLVAVFIALCMRRLVVEVRLIRDLLGDPQATRKLGHSSRHSWHGPHGGLDIGLGYFTIWEWRQGNWKLKSAVVPPGCDPGSPPPHRGAFDGDHVKKWVPSS
jgi:hypothetical protein